MWCYLPTLNRGRGLYKRRSNYFFCALTEAGWNTALAWFISITFPTTFVCDCSSRNPTFNNLKDTWLRTPTGRRQLVGYLQSVVELTRGQRETTPGQRPGARFSKVPITFRARQAICETGNRLFGKADLKTCFKGNKKKNYCEVWQLKSSPLLRYKGNCDTRKWPVNFRDFRETGPRTGFEPRATACKPKALTTGPRLDHTAS